MAREASQERAYSYADAKRLCAAVLAEDRGRKEPAPNACSLACPPEQLSESFGALKEELPDEGDAVVTPAALDAFEAAVEQFIQVIAEKRGQFSGSVQAKVSLERILLDTPKDWLGYAGPADIYRRIREAHGEFVALPNESAPAEERKRASLSLLLSVFSRMDKPQDRVDEEFQTAIQIIEIFKADQETDKTLAQLRAFDPSSAARIILAPVEGICLMRNGESLAAAELLEKSIKMGLDTSHLRNALGYCYWQANRTDDAALQFQRVLDVSSEDDYALTQLIEFSALEGSLETGLDYAERLVKVLPESPAAWNLKAWLLLQLGKASEAEEAGATALALAPGNLDAVLGLSDANRATGREADAQELLRKALRFASGKAFELGAVGNRLLDANMPAEALAAFEQAALLEPEDAKYYLCGVAESHYSLKHWRHAMETYEQVEALRPWSGEDAFQWANACCELGEFEKAERKLQELLQEKPEDVYLWDALGLLFLCSKRPSQALNAFDEYLSRYWEQPAVHFYAGMAHLRLGNLKTARQKLCDLEPLSKTWTKRLAREIEVADASLIDYLNRPIVPVWSEEEQTGDSRRA